MLFFYVFIYILYYIYLLQLYLFNYCFSQGPVEDHILCERVTLVKDQKKYSYHISFADRRHSGLLPPASWANTGQIEAGDRRTSHQETCWWQQSKNKTFLLLLIIVLVFAMFYCCSFLTYFTYWNNVPLINYMWSCYSDCMVPTTRS